MKLHEVFRFIKLETYHGCLRPEPGSTMLPKVVVELFDEGLEVRGPAELIAKLPPMKGKGMSIVMDGHTQQILTVYYPKEFSIPKDIEIYEHTLEHDGILYYANDYWTEEGKGITGVFYSNSAGGQVIFERKTESFDVQI